MYQQTQKCLTDVLMHLQKAQEIWAVQMCPQVPMTYGEHVIGRTYSMSGEYGDIQMY